MSEAHIKELEAQIADLRSKLDKYGLRELARAGQDCEAGWKPIKTVPKDGTVILIFSNEKGIEGVYAARNKEELGCWAAPVGHDYPWQFLCSEHGYKFLPDYAYITHWMPLPEPPKEQPHE